MKESQCAGVPLIVYIICILSTADIGLNFCFSLLQSNLSGHKNIIGYVDSSITHTGNGVYEVLLLMPYCKVNMLGMMNSRYMTRFVFAPVYSLHCLPAHRHS